MTKATDRIRRQRRRTARRRLDAQGGKTRTVLAAEFSKQWKAEQVARWRAYEAENPEARPGAAILEYIAELEKGDG